MPGVSMLATSAPRPPVSPPPAFAVAAGFAPPFGSLVGVAAFGAGLGLGVGATGFVVTGLGGVGGGVAAGASCTAPIARSPAGAANMRTMIIGGDGGGAGVRTSRNAAIKPRSEE